MTFALRNFSILCLLANLIGCSGIQRNFTSKTTDISGVSVSTTPLLADLVVDPKRKSITFTHNDANSKSAALLMLETKKIISRQLVDKYKADYLVEPVFQMLSTNPKSVEVQLTAYVAYFKNFRNAPVVKSK
jgi:hypothetical protein